MFRTSPGAEEAKLAVYAVIQQLTDSQEELVEIGEQLRDRRLKRFFLTESLKRAQFRAELEALLNREGVSEVRKSGVTGGVAHRAWGRLKSQLGVGDHALLTTAERNEDAAREAYANAISMSLPLPIREVLSTQASHIHRSHKYVKAARDLTMEKVA